MPRGLRIVLWYLLVASLPVGAALFRVWVRQDVVELGYELSKEESRRQRLAEELRQLEVELAAERAPARLARLAKKLGLGPPGPEQIMGAPDRGQPGGSPLAPSAVASGEDHGQR